MKTIFGGIAAIAFLLVAAIALTSPASATCTGCTDLSSGTGGFLEFDFEGDMGAVADIVGGSKTGGTGNVVVREVGAQTLANIDQLVALTGRTPAGDDGDALKNSSVTFDLMQVVRTGGLTTGRIVTDGDEAMSASGLEFLSAFGGGGRFTFDVGNYSWHD